MAVDETSTENIDTSSIDDLLKSQGITIGEGEGGENGTVNGDIDLTKKPVDSYDDDEIKSDADETKVDSNKGESADTQTQHKIDGVIARDGKNLIPFSVLEGTRNAQQAAEDLARQQAETIEQLNAQLAATKNGEKQDFKQIEVELMTEEELALLDEEMPSYAAITRKQQAVIQQQQQALAAISEKNEQVQQEQHEEARQTAGEKIRDAIDGNAKLAHIEANNPELWDKAKALDVDLRKTDMYLALPFEDRFKKVVALLELDEGEIVIDNAVNREDAAAQAKAKVDKAGVPNSLSDMPSGKADDGVNDDLSNATSAQIGARYVTKTADQILASLKDD